MYILGTDDSGPTMIHLARCLAKITSMSTLAAFLCWSMPALPAPALQVAAAADLAMCIGELNAAFAKSVGGADIQASIGSSGNFYAQIKNGAPFDVFLSADIDYPRELIKAGLADGATLMVYAHGQLMMWTTDPSVDVSLGLALLNDPKIKRIAIANPAVAPYGRAAKAALEKAALWDALRPKLVLGESVAQVAQFVQSRNAEVGFVGISHVQSANGDTRGARGQSWKVPQDLYPLIEQGGVVTAKGRGNPLALKYLDFLRSEAGHIVLRKFGFVLPADRP